MDKDEYRESVDGKLDRLEAIEEHLDLMDAKLSAIKSELSSIDTNTDDLSNVQWHLQDIHNAMSSENLKGMGIIMLVIALELGYIIHLIS